MIVLVFGGRWYGELWQTSGQPLPEALLAQRKRERVTAREALDELHHGPLGPITKVIQGGAKGGDARGREWAEANHVPVKTFQAHWHELKKAAGPIRNQEMLDKGKPDYGVKFPGGKGTADMLHRAKAAGLKLKEIE